MLLGRTGIEDIKVRTVTFFVFMKFGVCGFLFLEIDIDHFIFPNQKGKTLCLGLVPSHDCSLSSK